MWKPSQSQHVNKIFHYLKVVVVSWDCKFPVVWRFGSYFLQTIFYYCAEVVMSPAHTTYPGTDSDGINCSCYIKVIVNNK